MGEPLKSSSKSKSSGPSRIKKDVKPEYSSDFLRKKLLEHFKHSDFKSTLQKEAIQEIMRGNRDVYVSMPTGSGKSLCFQLPGMLHDNKITIVFSPLIALIKDQMDHLTKLKICAESLNSKMTMKERERVIYDLRSIKPNTKFLYITPEQAATDFFRGLLDSIVKYNKLALVAVDECHCVSEMGHQFRRDYLKLGELRQRYPTVKWIALTATASTDVTSDVFKQLHLKEPKSFKTPCFRKNLFYDIIYKNSIQDDYDHLKDFALKCLKSKTGEVKSNNAPCGIIYCRTRESVERVAVGLSKQNIATKPYHAGLNDKDRKQIQEDWMNGKFPVICATNSFGMGVDKATVRFVVHWDVPQNIAAYYQESGRAGRDGKQSYCRLYYCRQEVKSIGFLLNLQLQKTPDCVKAKRSVKEFEKLVDHCEAMRCRHLLFSAYFGDHAPDCKKRQLCDVCKDNKQSEKKLDTFHRFTHSSYATKMDVDFDTSDLYEGGRNAVHEAETSYSQYNDDECSESSSSARDTRAKKETGNLIQREFERRKQKIELAKKLEQTQTRSFGIRIKSSIHTNKISGLDVKKRESYLDFLLKVLKENAEKSTEKPAHNLKSCDFEDIAAEMEYNCFTKNRVLAMYTKSVTVERLRIDRSTKNKELLPEIRNHEPKKRTAHGGSSEAMQKDLDEFLKQHNIAEKSNTTTQSSGTTTNTNVGFRTARQLNNKLKEPNRMKKDPLTQMSINSFFSNASIKREPQDNDENEEENIQDAKRRKVEETAQIRVKGEPIDTNDVAQQVNVKAEPEDYDSDTRTEKADSDDEMDTQTKTQVNDQSVPDVTPIPNVTPNVEAQNTQEIPTIAYVKMEQNSDVDTDEASDEEDAAMIVRNNNRKSSQVANGSKTKPRQTNEIEPNHRSEVEREPMATQELAQRKISTKISSKTATKRDRSCASALDSIGMIVSEPSVLEDDDIKKEPEDEPVRSDEETDDESSVHPSNISHQNIKTEPQDNSYVPPYNEGNFEKKLQQQPSTSNSIYYSINRKNLPPAPSAAIYHRRQSTTAREPLNEVGTRSKPVSTSDGRPLLRFNNFESVVNDEWQQKCSVEVHDDDDEIMEDLHDDVEKYVKNLEEKFDEEFDQLKKIKLENLNREQLMNLQQRLAQLKRKKQTMMHHKIRETVKKSEEEKEKIRDDFLQDLYGLTFDVQELEQKLNIVPNQPQPSTSNASTNGTDDKKQMIKYNEFMKKPKVKPDTDKTMKEHLLGMAQDEYIKKMHNENKLDGVPQRIIDKVKKDKNIIKTKVARYLMPYYNNGEIDRGKYETICANVTHFHYDSNNYDSREIKKRVDRMVKAVKERINTKPKSSP